MLKAIGGDVESVIAQGLAPGAHAVGGVVLVTAHVEDGPGGAGGGVGALLFPVGAGDGGQVGLLVELFEDGFGEVEPGDGASVGDVVEAGEAGIEEVQRGIGQIVRERWRAGLIVDDGERLFLAGQFDHGAGEAGAAGAVEPGGSDDERVGVGGGESFAVELGAAVGALGVGGVGLGVGLTLGAVEDEVG